MRMYDKETKERLKKGEEVFIDYVSGDIADILEPMQDYSIRFTEDLDGCWIKKM